jgi:parallel beta-helix repeat protein
MVTGPLSQIQNEVNLLKNGDTLTIYGHFSINGTILFNRLSDITIIGEDLEITQTGYNTTTMKFDHCCNVTISNIKKLIGEPSCYNPDLSTNGLGIYFYQCTGIHNIDNVGFYDNASSGFKAYQTHDVHFNNCIFDGKNVNIKYEDRFCTGVHAEQNSNQRWTINNCIFENLAIGGIFYTNQNDTHVSNCLFYNMRGQHGLYFNTANNSSIHDCTFINCCQVAAKFQFNTGEAYDHYNLSMYNNYIHTSSDRPRAIMGLFVGCAVAEPTYNTWFTNVRIYNNTINNSQYGIRIQRVEDAKIYNNIISNIDWGIQTINCLDYDIYDNTITNYKIKDIYSNNYNIS